MYRILENIAGESETASQTGDSKTLYQLVKVLSSPDSKSGLPIKDHMGKTLWTHEVQAKQRKHHFETILNFPEATVLHDFKTHLSPADIDVDVNEVNAAIRKLTNNKTANIKDNILAE